MCVCVGFCQARSERRVIFETRGLRVADLMRRRQSLLHSRQVTHAYISKRTTDAKLSYVHHLCHGQAGVMSNWANWLEFTSV